MATDAQKIALANVVAKQGGVPRVSAANRPAAPGVTGNDLRHHRTLSTVSDTQMTDVNWLDPPTGPDGEVLIVDVRVNALKISEIDTVYGRAGVNVAIIFYWDDPRLADWEGVALPDTLWGPKFKLINALPDMMEIDDDFMTTSVGSTRLKRVWRYMGTVDNPMDLREFPFDLDTVDLNFMTGSHWQSKDGKRHGSMANSRSYRLRRVHDPAEGRWLELKWPGDVSEWTLHGASTILRDDPKSVSGTENSWLFIKFHLSREFGYYFWKALLPLYMLNVLSLTGFHFTV